MDRCVLLTSTPECVVSPRGETTHAGVDVNSTHVSMINPDYDMMPTISALIYQYIYTYDITETLIRWLNFVSLSSIRAAWLHITILQLQCSYCQPQRRISKYSTMIWKGMNYLMILLSKEMLLDFHSFHANKWLNANILRIRGGDLSTLNVRRPSFLGLNRSISWLLMPWLLTLPGHQQLWYLPCRIGRLLSYLRKDFNNLRRINVVKWHKMKIYVYVSSEKFST